MCHAGARKQLQGRQMGLAKDRANTQYALRKQAFEDERADNKMSDMRGVGGLAANTMLGVGDLKAKKKLAGMYGLGVLK